MERRGPGHSSPFGQACLSCFKSKSKCVARPDGDGCQRCHRLQKECLPSDELRRRAADSKKTYSTRLASLEGRLDTLVSLLQPANGVGVVTTPQQAADLHHVTSDSPERPAASHLDEPSIAEAEAYLKVFRSRMLRHFPFMHLPANQTAQQLREDRPFLFRAIMAVVTPYAREKLARGRELKRELCETAASMDLLLGLLTYISWGWDHILIPSSLSRLMMVATSLVGEMGLNRPPPQELRMPDPFAPNSRDWDYDVGHMTTSLFLERQRAVLACFVLSSIVSLHFGQVDALRWTAQMDESLVAIGTSKERPEDAALALQVRFQLLAQRIAEVHDRHQRDQTQTETTIASAIEAITALQEQLPELPVYSTSGLQQQETLKAHAQYTKLYISETTRMVYGTVPLMTAYSTVAAAASNPLAPHISGTASPWVERLSCLWQSLRAVKACTTALLNLSASDFAGVSFLQWAQLVRCIMTLERLNTIEETGWDNDAVQDMVGPGFLESIAAKLDWAATVAAEQEACGVFTWLAKMIRNLSTSSERVRERVIEHNSATWLRPGWAADGVAANRDVQDRISSRPPVAKNASWLGKTY
ncbi:hypothetical protein GQ53DRAFT_853343, partial [Thozetella sp. PMI_491]